MKSIRILVIASALSASVAGVQASEVGIGSLRIGGPVFSSSVPTVRSWMSPEIGDAWREGFRGQGTTITVIDDFRSNRGSTEISDSECSFSGTGNGRDSRPT